jgi:hypothetical protein
MVRQGSSRDSYTGQGGQLAAQAELLMRQCNVATPVVDLGLDVFAFLDALGAVTHIQVKTANATPLKESGRYAARVSVPLVQLEDEDKVKLYYIFAVRLGERWADFVVIGRFDLRALARDESIGYRNEKAGELQLYLSFGPSALTCSSQDFQPYRNAWLRLPVLQAAGTAAEEGA